VALLPSGPQHTPKQVSFAVCREGVVPQATQPLRALELSWATPSAHLEFVEDAVPSPSDGIGVGDTAVLSGADGDTREHAAPITS